MANKLIAARVLYWIRGLKENPAQLFATLGVARSDHVLEVGCAIGYHTFALARIASQGRIYAVDVWEEGLAHLRKKLCPNINIEIIHASAEHVDLPAASLDKVICFDTLHAVSDPGAAVQRWVEWLRPGGQALYRDPELPAARIPELANEQLEWTDIVSGVHRFARSAGLRPSAFACPPGASPPGHSETESC